MSGSQSLTPQTVVPSRPRKRFTLAHANSSLPLVKRVVRDIVESHSAVLSRRDVAASLTGQIQQQAQVELEKSVETLQSYVEELLALGIELKDPATGLIDFPSEHDGRDVYLCWRLGEKSVTHWHELHDGFDGRKPTSELSPEE